MANRYQQSTESLQEAEEYYEKLCCTIKGNHLQRWNAEIVKAESRWFQTLAAMDIMGTRQACTLNDTPGHPERIQNKVEEDWIILALTIEERQ